MSAKCKPTKPTKPTNLKKAEVIPLQSVKGRCPLCKKPISVEYRPFCSKRCADKDLGQWLSESYRFESDEAPETLETTEDEQ